MPRHGPIRRSCTGFRMPAVSDLAGALAGVRKPSRNEPAVGGARRVGADYGDLAGAEVGWCWPCSALTRPMTWLLSRGSMR